MQITCLLDNLAKASCALEDIRDCYCPNVTTQYAVSSCVEASCSLADQMGK